MDPDSEYVFCDLEMVKDGDRVGVRAESVIEWVCVPLSVRTYVGVSVSCSVFVGGGVYNLVAVQT